MRSKHKEMCYHCGRYFRVDAGVIARTCDECLNEGHSSGVPAGCPLCYDERMESEESEESE